MHPAIRTQVDGLGDEASAKVTIDCSDDVDRARQEFKKETDVNYILTRFGLPASGRPMMFTDVDYTIDLQQAFSAMEQAKHAHRALPDNLRQKYTTWRDLLNALENGTLTIHGEEPPSDPITDPGNT